MKKLYCESCLKGWYVDDWEINNQTLCPFCGKNIKKEMKYDVIDNGHCGDHAQWTLYKDGTFIISGSGHMYNYRSGAGEYVTDSAWCRYKKKKKKVEIENGITSIGDYTFKGCYNLTNITIPNSVTKIGHFAFERCRSLTNITIPDGVTSIGSLAFASCNNLKSITIPNSVTDMGIDVFYDEISWIEIRIPAKARENMNKWDSWWKRGCIAEIVYI